MKILVYPHDLNIGGSQINAIDLAAGVAAEGHKVMVYGIEGPLVDYIRQRGLRFIAARPLNIRPAPSRILQLMRIAKREKLDLIHAYEWPPCLDAYFGAHLGLGIPLVSTVLSMSISPFVPNSIPLIMGTHDLGDEARRKRPNDVWVIEPPIDIDADHPGIDGSTFRQQQGVGASDLLIVTVSRLAVDLKLDALVRAVDATDLLADKYPVRLVIVGGGPAYAALKQRAEAVNQRRGRETIVLAGPSLDPRAAYAAADIVVGMGSSALRALAIGRPVVVQGEGGFSEVCEPATLPLFLKQGFYGMGDGAPDVSRLAGQLDRLLADTEARRVLGAYGRQLICDRFSLARAVQFQIDIYKKVRASTRTRRVGEAARAVALALRCEVSNHDPYRKRWLREQQDRIFETVRNGLWPPRDLNC